MQFLGGLNENYSQSRSQILMMPSIPSVNQAYSLIIHEESQRAHLNVVAQSSHSRPHYEESESSALAAAAVSRYGSDSKQKQRSIVSSRYDKFLPSSIHWIKIKFVIVQSVLFPNKLDFLFQYIILLQFSLFN